jgi:pilus assembly protein Flp/PilA
MSLLSTTKDDLIGEIAGAWAGLNRFLVGNASGATAIEYGLIAALIAVAAVTVMGTVGTNLSGTFNTIATAL